MNTPPFYATLILALAVQHAVLMKLERDLQFHQTHDTYVANEAGLCEFRIGRTE